MTTDTRSNTDIVRAGVDALNRHDIAELRTFWVPDVTERFPDAVCNGADEVAAYFQGIFDAIPDVHVEILAAAEQGENVFIRHVISGTHTGGPFKGVAPTGKRIEVPGMDHFVIRDGKVISNFVVFDQMEIGRQLGLLPPEDSAPDKAIKVLFNGGLAAKNKIRQLRDKS